MITLLALGVTFIVASSIYVELVTLVQALRTHEARFWVGPAANKATEPGRYWRNVSYKIFAILFFLPMLLIAGFVGVMGVIQAVA